MTLRNDGYRVIWTSQAIDHQILVGGRGSKAQGNTTKLHQLVSPCAHSPNDYESNSVCSLIAWPVSNRLTGANPNVCLYPVPSLTGLQKSGCFPSLCEALAELASVKSRKYHCPCSLCSSCPGSPLSAHRVRSYI